MDWLEQDEQRRMAGESLGRALARKPKAPKTPRKPSLMAAGPTLTPPPTDPKAESYIRTVEQKCEDCYGTGRDFGHPGHPLDAGDCAHCNGTGREIVTRNYLTEAFRIAQGESILPPEKEHLVAVIEHCRKLTSAALQLPQISTTERVA